MGLQRMGYKTGLPTPMLLDRKMKGERWGEPLKVNYFTILIIK